MSLVVESITLRNFLSVGAVAQTVHLDAAPLTLVLGRNLDVGGENSRNGVGKTSVLQAISYAWFGEPLTTIKKDNLINSINENGMLVTLVFHRDNVRYVIERGRKPNILRFFVGQSGEDVSRGENRVTQAEIERVVGMSHTIFAHIVALNTFTLPFLKMRPAEQREVIEELMGITQISELAGQLKLVMDAHKEELRDEEAAVNAAMAANDRIQRAIETAQSGAAQWEDTQNCLLDELAGRVERLAAIDIAAELAVFDQIEAWERQRQGCIEQQQAMQAQVASLDATLLRQTGDLKRYQAESVEKVSPEITRLHQQALRVRAECAQDVDVQAERMRSQAKRRRADAAAGRQAADRLEAERAEVRGQLDDPDQHACSVCQQPLQGTAHLSAVIAALERKDLLLASQIAERRLEAQQCDTDADATEAEIELLHRTHTAKQAGLREQAETIEAEIEVITATLAAERRAAQMRVTAMADEIKQVQQQRNHCYDELDEIASKLADFGRVPMSVYGSREAIRRLEQDRDRLYTQIETEMQRVNPHQSKVDALTSTLLSISYVKLNELANQLKHEQFLHKLLTSKDSFIRKRIIDQNLNFLNRHLNKYLDRLGLPHEVRFLPDLSVDITLGGRDYDFEQLSRGEMNRVILGNSWAFRDLWESQNTSVNLMFADEVLDQGTDEAGVEAAVQILTQMAVERQKNIFLISHRETLRSQIDRVLLVQKENQFTSIFEDGDPG